jgi:oligosaccharide reducing-end xylanase
LLAAIKWPATNVDLQLLIAFDKNNLREIAMKIFSKLKYCMAALAISLCAAEIQASPYTDSVWNTGNYHNMFYYYGVAIDDYVVRNRLQAQYDQFFKGKSDQTVMYSADDTAGAEKSYILDVASDDIRSEGMSYGMMIAVQMNDQATFDRLWRFTKAYMQNADKTLAWHLKKSDYSKLDVNPAPDGEEYMAMALFFAQGRFDHGRVPPDVHGEWLDTGINYKAEAQAILDVIRTKLFDSSYKQVLLVPGASAGNRITDPSYHLPAFYELWARLDTANADFWKEAHKQSRTYQFGGAHATTGLFSEYSTFHPGTTPVSNTDGAMTVTLAQNAGISEPQRSNAPYFFSDAHRVMGNMGMDFAWFTSCCLSDGSGSEWNTAAKLEGEVAARQFAFYSGRKDKDGSYISGYSLDGTPKSGVDYKAAGHVAMNAAGAIAVSPSNIVAKRYIEALWKQDIPTGKYRYYDGMLHMLAMLHVSGRYRIFAPLTSGVALNKLAGTYNQSQIAYTLRNTDQATQSNLTAYYYFTVENGRTPVVDDVYTPNISSLTLENFGGNHWAVRMQYAGVTLNSAQSVSEADNFRLHYSDWSTFDISNDFSAPKGSQSQSADRIAVFNSNGRLIMGAKPQGVYSIRVRARGATGQEVINLTVGGNVVASWKLSTSFANYDVTTNLGGGINVVYINDGGTRDVVVDYADIGGIVRQAEQQTNNTAAFGNGRCGGGQLTEWMHCNGYIGFSAYK